MTDIKHIIKAIKNDFTTVEGTVYTEGNGDINAKEALNILVNEVERLRKFEHKIKEKEMLEDLACRMAKEEEGKFSGLRNTDVDHHGIKVVMYCDYWDFSAGTSNYYYSWDALRKEFEKRNTD